MPIITLTTDFGYADYYTAQFKGDLIRTIPSVNIIDITHQIPAYNIVSGAYALKHTYRHFDEGTVHILRVNEQGIGNESVIMASYARHYFLAPNNGILSLVLQQNFDWMYTLNFNFFKHQNANYIYAEACKYLLMEKDFPENMLFPPDEFIQLTDWAVSKYDNKVRGMVVLVDNFGNLITNIHLKDVYGYLEQGYEMTIHYRDRGIIEGVVNYYNDVQPGEQLARFNDEGYLEIAQNQGSAASLLGIKFGDIVNIQFK